MSYNELTKSIEDTQRDLDLATTAEEINYFGIKLLVLEEKLEKTISKGRR